MLSSVITHVSVSTLLAISSIQFFLFMFMFLSFSFFVFLFEKKFFFLEVYYPAYTFVLKQIMNKFNWQFINGLFSNTYIICRLISIIIIKLLLGLFSENFLYIL